ncbi:LacI family transcriptional regulator [Egibacter rhizosphaerae]|uniref:LacI family transcriptional regulator n=1 Tax=Egibacter rhizosphaerae TaxID=1670831 RepID=A0A411YC67_9ACTN|nr:LacI family DNA-binding transcriptional regulator [Egibacter rhizosphaerae]QBI18799.1 LacI family transcriptional regulator [Egibacter rhizosphaerae]
MATSTTLLDVAQAAGVSIATASRALNGSRDRRVRPELEQRVWMAARSLNYTPNSHAQAVARGQTSVAGLVVHDIADPYFSSIAKGLMAEAASHQLVVTVAATDRDPEQEFEYVRMLRMQRARALVLAGSRLDDRELLDRLGEELAAYEETGGRAVLVSQKRLPVDTVQVENRAGARALARELHGLGHRRFAVLATAPRLITSRDRTAGFRTELAQLGAPVPPERVVEDEFTRDGGYRAMHRLLELDPTVTCVFAVNDVMAVGALAALREVDRVPPDGIGVAGFDDIATLRDITPGLTTVRLPLQHIGAEALRLAVEEPSERPRVRRVAGEVVLRDSTPPLTAEHPTPS